MSMDTTYCNYCGLLHDPEDGDCLGCELVKEKIEIKKKLRGALKDCEWAYMTLKDQLKFGLPEDVAIKRREGRARGVFQTTIETLKEILGEENEEVNDNTDNPA